MTTEEQMLIDEIDKRHALEQENAALKNDKQGAEYNEGLTLAELDQVKTERDAALALVEECAKIAEDPDVEDTIWEYPDGRQEIEGRESATCRAIAKAIRALTLPASLQAAGERVRRIREALEHTVCGVCDNRIGWNGKEPSNCGVCRPARAALGDTTATDEQGEG